MFKKLSLCATFFAFISPLFAENLEVRDLPGTYVTKEISASAVHGVEVRLKKTVLTDGCNNYSIIREVTNRDAPGRRTRTRYLISANISQTEKLCINPVPVEKTLESAPFIIDAYRSRGGWSYVRSTIIIPEDYELIVKEIPRN